MNVAYHLIKIESRECHFGNIDLITYLSGDFSPILNSFFALKPVSPEQQQFTSNKC